MKKWTAFRRQLAEPLEWMFLDGQQAVFHRIEEIETIQTPDGEMLAVKIRQKVDLADPKFDVVALVGQAKQIRKSGVVDPQSPELWYWNDRFWLKAVDSQGTEYYNRKCYLFYAVQVQNSDELLGGLRHHWQDETQD